MLIQNKLSTIRLHNFPSLIVAYNLLFHCVRSFFTVDLESSNQAIEIYKELKKKTKMIDLADILIAATSISQKLPLATLNLKHFQRINELEIINL